MQRAHQLSEIMQVLKPAPLQASELNDFFVETSKARDPKFRRRIAIEQYLQSDEDVKVLVVGHAGAGKSTELVKFQEENASKYAFFSFSLLREAQLAQVSIEMLLVLIVETIVNAFQDKKLGVLNETTLETIYGWFDETFKIKENDIKYGAEIGAGIDTKASYIGKLLGVSAYLKTDIKAGAHTLNKSITKDNKRLSELVAQCNVLINEAKIALSNAKQGEMLFIIEDLDKAPIESAMSIFIENPAPLAGLACKAIYTAPLWLLCNSRAGVLDASFVRVTIPMIKVENQDGSPCKEGRDVIKDIVDKRLDVNALVEEDALELAIEKTGGVLRHLFNVLSSAASVAAQAVKYDGRTASKIAKVDVRYGLDSLRADLVRSIGVFGLPKEFTDDKITVDAMFDRLREIHESRKTVESNRIDLLLLQSHAVIEYNGACWHRVHPLIAEYLEERYANASTGAVQPH